MSEVTVYMFSSSACAPCQHIKPTICELREDYANFTWVDTELRTPEAARFDVKSIPTMVITYGNTVLGKHSGASAMGYYSLLKKATQQS